MKRLLAWTLASAPVWTLALLEPGEDPTGAPRLVWGDYDVDGLSDLVALEPDGSVRLLRNLGDGALEDVTEASGLASPARSASWQDVDGDGLPDLFLVAPDARGVLYRGLGTGQFVDVTEQSGLDGALDCSDARWIDYDGDGHADLELWTPAGVRLLHNDGSGFLESTPLAWAARPAAQVEPAVAPGRDEAGAAAEPDGLDVAPQSTAGSSRVAVGGPGVGGIERAGTGVSVGGSTRVGPALPGSSTEYCAPGIEDESGTYTCISASSVPTINRLFPLTSDLFVDTDGDVGMGTTNPRSHLHVRGALAESNLRLSTVTANGTSKLLMLENDNGETNLVGGAVAYNGAIGFDQIQFNTLGSGTETTRMVIERQTGDVGINTTDPIAPLHVVGGPNLGTIIVAPNSAATGQNSRVVLGENDNADFGFVLRYQGDANEMRFAGLNNGVGTTHVAIGRDTGKMVVGGATGSGRFEVQSDHTGTNNAAIRSVNTSTGAGNALYAESNGDGTTAIFTQNGTGAILKGNLPDGSTVFRVNNSGRVVTTALEITGGGDLVEGFESREELEPGTVVAIDPDEAGKLVATREAYDTKVAGVVSGANGVDHGIRMGQHGVLDGEHLVAMAGRVYVRCTGEGGPIRPGDLLTSASREGHAMRAADGGRAFGAVIGKAMTALDAESGLVLVLVNLQ